ncbi:MAG TPA: YqgE/AlgH family protein, partial [Usitatibacter sp.]|nr:YqgE/AlgH family protein [Usitatibacter sp.]
MDALAGKWLRAAAAALWALTLPCGMAGADEAKPLTTLLMVARDELPDRNFRDAVVLVMNNLAPGPVGVITNRPTSLALSRVFPEIERLKQHDGRVYFGGPVALGVVSFLFRAEKPPERATPVLDGVYFSMDTDLLHALLEREQPMEGLRVFAGYAGWAPGQLQAEIAHGDWKLEAAEADSLFGHRRELPWPEREGADKLRRG